MADQPFTLNKLREAIGEIPPVPTIWLLKVHEDVLREHLRHHGVEFETSPQEASWTLRPLYGMPIRFLGEGEFSPKPGDYLFTGKGFVQYQALKDASAKFFEKLWKERLCGTSSIKNPIGLRNYLSDT